ncbi:MAG: AIR synthase family protein [Caldilineaceae bacterium]
MSTSRITHRVSNSLPVMTTLPAGKLPPQLLHQLLGDLPTYDPQLILGPAVGEDAAVIDFTPTGDKFLVAKSDPITFATDEIGYYAVNVCTNDLAVTGARPRFYLPTLLLPAGTTDAALVSRIFGQIGAACRALGIVVAGGHSEITPTVTQPVIAGTLLGEVERDKVVSSGGAQAGDMVLLAGHAAVEGTSIIAREKRNELRQRGWSSTQLDEAANYLYSPGISVLKPAMLAAEQKLVTAMHDPTEGGVATALVEIATASKVGLTIYLDAIPVSELSRQLCAEFGLDPLGTIASGALLATARATNVEKLIKLWRSIGWYAAVIGAVTKAEQGITGQWKDKANHFPNFLTDEITKLWV